MVTIYMPTKLEGSYNRKDLAVLLGSLCEFVYVYVFVCASVCDSVIILCIAMSYL